MKPRQYARQPVLAWDTTVASRNPKMMLVTSRSSSADAHVDSKTGRIKKALADGDRLTALRIASRFHDRSTETMMFKRGFDAHQHPDFYRQIGKEPAELISKAVRRLRARFDE
jgi:hypothetical protein